MIRCPEGAYTLGHMWMAGLAGMGAMAVLYAILRDVGILRDPKPPDPPPEG